jgi:4'-phosphopantetheinyl transferase
MDVGVDVEAIRATVDVKGMAAKFMTRAEERALAALPVEERLAACFRCWARKEAFVKGTGAGLGFPLREVDVWNGDSCPATVSGWSVHDVDVAPGLAAAVAGASLDDWVPEAPRRLGS